MAHSGEADDAMEILERLVADRFPAISVHTIRLDPLWDPIRDHARFRALLAKYGT
jgi:hypothetical protein